MSRLISVAYIGEPTSPLFRELVALRIQERAIRALIAEYRKVSDLPNHSMYVRDLERIFDPSLPPVKDSDGRTDWTGAVQ